MKKETQYQLKKPINRVGIYILNTAEVKLEDSLGYVLAEDIVATYDIPRFNKSPYDGFAIRSKEFCWCIPENRKQFKVIDHIGAGSVSEKILGQNEEYVL